MIRKCVTLAVVLVFGLAIGFQPDLHAGSSNPAVAFDNATVQPGGPRPGDFGKIFFNMEGINNDPFDSFGVADFNSADLQIGFQVGSIQSVTIALAQANAAFTHDGAINFYITEDTATDIQPDTSPLSFVASDSEGVDGQLQTLHPLGSGMFTQTGSGDVDSYSFQPDDATAQYLIGQINGGGTIRIVITPADPDVSATYAGYLHDTFPGPTLIVSASE
jgi:hypothetical protein